MITWDENQGEGNEDGGESKIHRKACFSRKKRLAFHHCDTMIELFYCCERVVCYYGDKGGKVHNSCMFLHV